MKDTYQCMPPPPPLYESFPVRRVRVSSPPLSPRSLVPEKQFESDPVIIKTIDQHLGFDLDIPDLSQLFLEEHTKTEVISMINTTPMMKQRIEKMESPLSNWSVVDLTMESSVGKSKPSVPKVIT